MHQNYPNLLLLRRRLLGKRRRKSLLVLFIKCVDTNGNKQDKQGSSCASLDKRTEPEQRDERMKPKQRDERMKELHGRGKCRLT